MNANFKDLEARYNTIASKNNTSLRQKTIEKLSLEAKALIKEIEKLNKKYIFLEEKLEKTLNNIENIDDYLALKSSKQKEQQEENDAI